MPSLDQSRAESAYRAIDELGADALDLARKLPVMLQTNGLLATWAFLLAKRGAHRRCLDQLLAHLRARQLVADGSDEAMVVFQRWVGTRSGGELTGPELRRLTGEAIDFAVWLKRAAEAHGEGSP